jgi:hypothetical protein
LWDIERRLASFQKKTGEIVLTGIPIRGSKVFFDLRAKKKRLQRELLS